MMDRPTIVGIAGSRRDGSYTRTTVERVLDACEATGAETDLLALGDVDRAFDDRGGIIDPDLNGRVEEFAESLVEHAERYRDAAPLAQRR